MMDVFLTFCPTQEVEVFLLVTTVQGQEWKTKVDVLHNNINLTERD